MTLEQIYAEANREGSAYRWAIFNGGLELALHVDDAHQGSHQGACDDDIAALAQKPYIAAQLAEMDADRVRDELREYGAWDDEELSDEAQNLHRLLWVSCGNINEEG